MKASLKDIASRLNLSITTVSWVLSGKGDEKNISKKTQERIIRCAEEISYQPNLIARSLNIGVSNTIGLILPSISDRFFSQIAESVEMEALKYGYSLMICNSSSELPKENKMIETLKAKQVDGIIVAPTQLSSEKYRLMLDEDYPFVLFDSYFPDLPTNYVVIDNEASGFQLTKHLIEKGAKKIAAITTNPHLITLQQRYEGYCRAHKRALLEVNPDLKGIVEFAGYERNTVRVLDEIFDKVPDVDGFYFISHILAIEALLYMYEKGIDINGFHMACIHEVTSFRVLAPRMNTAVFPTEAMGKEAVGMLINEIQKKSKKKEDNVSYKKAAILSTSIFFRD